jgi:hypothetical protein
VAQTSDEDYLGATDLKWVEVNSIHASVANFKTFVFWLYTDQIVPEERTIQRLMSLWIRGRELREPGFSNCGDEAVGICSRWC